MNPINSEPLYRNGRHYDRTNESYRDDIPYYKAAQVNHIKWRYRIGEKEFTHQLNMRIFFPLELEALLIHNGFIIETKYGDFDASPFASASLKQIPVCSTR